MVTLKMQAKTNRRGTVTFRVPPHLRSSELEMVIIIDNKKTPRTPLLKKYDFSDLAGRLHWKGNAVTQQRRLRNEW
jgi:hypothetical protein